MLRSNHRLGLAALLVSVAALVVALSGTAITASSPTNSVGAKALKRIAVRGTASPNFASPTAHDGIPARQTVEVRCLPGEVALGSGLDWSAAHGPAVYEGGVLPIFTKTEPIGYEVTGLSDESDPSRFTAWIACLRK